MSPMVGSFTCDDDKNFHTEFLTLLFSQHPMGQHVELQ